MPLKPDWNGSNTLKKQGIFEYVQTHTYFLFFILTKSRTINGFFRFWPLTGCEYVPEAITWFLDSSDYEKMPLCPG